MTDTTWPKNVYPVAYLKSGEIITGQGGDLTKEEHDKTKAGLSEILGSNPDEGGHVNIETVGGWSLIPLSSIDYMRLVVH